jgi:hypothetical protein
MPETPAPKEDGKEKKPEGRWALFTGIGSFILYFFGYLSLRFHLSVLGVDTGLSVLDERYLFAGAQFLVYLVSSVPLALLPVFLGRWTRKRLPAAWLRRPDRLMVLGIALSIALIQLVMRRCLLFTNLLLRRELPDPGWVQALLLDGTDALQPLYFTVVLACVIGLASVLVGNARRKARTWPFLYGVFALLVLIQFLLLPVTFGIVIANQELPRVTTLNGKEKLEPGVEAWRVWEGKDSVTFFVRRWDQDGCKVQKSLLTLENKGIERTEISGYDRVLKLLYGWPGGSGCK